MPKIALITGASSGLGAEFARQLSAQGYDLVLTARRLPRLEALAQELQAQFSISAQVLPADLSTREGMETLEECISHLPALDLLINNAGFGTNGPFVAVERSAHDAMLQVHITAAVRLTHAALPGMLARGQGGIINVASMAGILPIRSELYGSTKAFLILFSQAVQSQLRGRGVHIQALCPGFTITEFHETPAFAGFDRRQIPRWLWLHASKVVHDSLQALPRQAVVCIPGVQYRLIALLTRLPLAGAITRFVGDHFFANDHPKAKEIV